MASVSKVGERYKVRWRVGDKERAQRFATRAEAQAFRLQVEHDLANGAAIADESTTLSAWAEQWQTTRLGLRASTVARNESLYRVHIRDALGAYRLADLTQPVVQRWVGSLARKGLAPATVAHCYQELNKCLTAAVTAKVLRTNPCVGIELPKADHAEMAFLTTEQVRLLANSIDERYRALVYLLAYGGLRIGEAAALTCEDVTPKGVSVTKTAVEVQGIIRTNAPKTKAGRRVVPLPASVVTMLAEHAETYPGALLFTGRDGGQLRAGVFRQRHFNKAVRAASQAIANENLPIPPFGGLRVHDLRHTAVSFWIAQGVDLLRIKKWAGHTRSTFTLDRYGHLIEDDNAAILDRLNQRVL